MTTIEGGVMLGSGTAGWNRVTVIPPLWGYDSLEAVGHVKRRELAHRTSQGLDRSRAISSQRALRSTFVSVEAQLLKPNRKSKTPLQTMRYHTPPISERDTFCLLRRPSIHPPKECYQSSISCLFCDHNHATHRTSSSSNSIQTFSYNHPTNRTICPPTHVSYSSAA